MAHLRDPNPFDPDDAPDLDEPEQLRPDIIAAQDYVVPEGVAEAGQAVIFKEETQETTDQGFLETRATHLYFCCGCGSALLELSHVAARCAICGRILCPGPGCGPVQCALCGRSCCQEHRIQLGSSVF